MTDNNKVERLDSFRSNRLAGCLDDLDAQLQSVSCGLHAEPPLSHCALTEQKDWGEVALKKLSVAREMSGWSRLAGRFMVHLNGEMARDYVKGEFSAMQGSAGMP